MQIVLYHILALKFEFVLERQEDSAIALHDRCIGVNIHAYAMLQIHTSIASTHSQLV